MRHTNYILSAAIEHTASSNIRTHILSLPRKYINHNKFKTDAGDILIILFFHYPASEKFRCRNNSSWVGERTRQSPSAPDPTKAP